MTASTYHATTPPSIPPPLPPVLSSQSSTTQETNLKDMRKRKSPNDKYGNINGLLQGSELPGNRVNAAINRMLTGVHLSSSLWTQSLGGGRGLRGKNSSRGSPNRGPVISKKGIVYDYATAYDDGEFYNSRDIHNSPRLRLLHRYGVEDLPTSNLERSPAYLQNISRQKSEDTNQKLKEAVVDEIADDLRQELGLLDLGLDKDNNGMNGGSPYKGSSEKANSSQDQKASHLFECVDVLELKSKDRVESGEIEDVTLVPSEGVNCQRVLEEQKGRGGDVNIQEQSGVYQNILRNRKCDKHNTPAVIIGAPSIPHLLGTSQRQNRTSHVKNTPTEDYPTYGSPSLLYIPQPNQRYMANNHNINTTTHTRRKRDSSVKTGILSNQTGEKSSVAEHQCVDKLPSVAVGNHPENGSPGTQPSLGVDKLRATGDPNTTEGSQNPRVFFGSDEMEDVEGEGRGGVGEEGITSDHQHLSTQCVQPPQIQITEATRECDSSNHRPLGSPVIIKGVSQSPSQTAIMIRDKKIPPIPSLRPPPLPAHIRFECESLNDSHEEVLDDEKLVEEKKEIVSVNSQVLEDQAVEEMGVVPDGVNKNHLPLLRAKKIFEKDLALRLEKKMEEEDFLIGDLKKCLEMPTMREQVETTMKVVQDAFKTKVVTDRETGNKLYRVIVDLGRFHRKVRHKVNDYVVEIEGSTYGPPETTLSKVLYLEFPESVEMEKLFLKQYGNSVEIEVPFKPKPVIENQISLETNVDRETMYATDNTQGWSNKEGGIDENGQEGQEEPPPELPMSPPPPFVIKEPKPMRRRQRSFIKDDLISERSVSSATNRDSGIWSNTSTLESKKSHLGPPNDAILHQQSNFKKFQGEVQAKLERHRDTCVGANLENSEDLKIKDSIEASNKNSDPTSNFKPKIPLPGNTVENLSVAQTTSIFTPESSSQSKLDFDDDFFKRDISSDSYTSLDIGKTSITKENLEQEGEPVTFVTVESLEVVPLQKKLSNSSDESRGSYDSQRLILKDHGENDNGDEESLSSVSIHMSASDSSSSLSSDSEPEPDSNNSFEYKPKIVPVIRIDKMNELDIDIHKEPIRTNSVSPLIKITNLTSHSKESVPSTKQQTLLTEKDIGNFELIKHISRETLTHDSTVKDGRVDTCKNKTGLIQEEQLLSQPDTPSGSLWESDMWEEVRSSKMINTSLDSLEEASLQAETDSGVNISFDTYDDKHFRDTASGETKHDLKEAKRVSRHSITTSKIRWQKLPIPDIRIEDLDQKDLGEDIGGKLVSPEFRRNSQSCEISKEHEIKSDNHDSSKTLRGPNSEEDTQRSEKDENIQRNTPLSIDTANERNETEESQNKIFAKEVGQPFNNELDMSKAVGTVSNIIATPLIRPKEFGTDPRKLFTGEEIKLYDDQYRGKEQEKYVLSKLPATKINLNETRGQNISECDRSLNTNSELQNKNYRGISIEEEIVKKYVSVEKDLIHGKSTGFEIQTDNDESMSQYEIQRQAEQKTLAHERTGVFESPKKENKDKNIAVHTGIKQNVQNKDKVISKQFEVKSPILRSKLLRKAWVKSGAARHELSKPKRFSAEEQSDLQNETFETALVKAETCPHIPVVRRGSERLPDEIKQHGVENVDTKTSEDRMCNDPEDRFALGPYILHRNVISSTKPDEKDACDFLPKPDDIEQSDVSKFRTSLTALRTRNVRSTSIKTYKDILRPTRTNRWSVDTSDLGVKRSSFEEIGTESIESDTVNRLKQKFERLQDSNEIGAKLSPLKNNIGPGNTPQSVFKRGRFKSEKFSIDL